jgi:hypothetical protein
MNDDQSAIGRFIPAGAKVRDDGTGEPEFGIVVHCWVNEEAGGYDCYVAFFGNEFPSGKPMQKPYVLRYFASSLNVVSE